MFACTPADDWMRSPGTVNAGQSWSYNIPARPGDVITLQARALDKFIKRERLFVVHDNGCSWCTTMCSSTSAAR